VTLSPLVFTASCSKLNFAAGVEEPGDRPDNN
jgi:hypothetical protein